MADPDSAVGLDDLARLAREIGDVGRHWVILAEGNVSMRTSPRTMHVKASGVRMSRALPSDMLEMDLPTVLSIIDDPAGDEQDVQRLFDAVHARTGARPSVESLLHAVCLDLTGVDVAGHAHPTPLLAVLSSTRSEEVLCGLFPDQIVVLGRSPLYVPYVDPGLALAREARRLLRERGDVPRVIYLENHGVFALGASADEVVQIIEMATKAAEVLLCALAVGGARPLPEHDARRIDTRPDELYRRRALAGPAPDARTEGFTLSG